MIGTMSSAIDSDLLTKARARLDNAASMLGTQAVSGPTIDPPGVGPTPPDYTYPPMPINDWDGVARRAEDLLDDMRKRLRVANKANVWRHGASDKVIANAAQEVKGSAEAGLSPASEAIEAVRVKLRHIAIGATAVAAAAGLAPFILPLLIFLAIEHSGYGKRARGAARRYVSGRARAYGF
jgi:hypothetical protein